MKGRKTNVLYLGLNGYFYSIFDIKGVRLVIYDTERKY